MQNAFCTNFQRIYWYFSLHSDFFCFRMLSSSKKAFFILQSGSCSYQNDPAAFCSLPGIRFQFNFVSQTSVFWLLVRIFPRQIPLIILTQFFTDGQTSFLKTFI